MTDHAIPDIVLNDGTTLPAIGFGTYKLNGKSGIESMVSGISAGYRLLDSAANYDNEGALGEAIRSAGVAREKLRVVSKLAGRYHQFDAAIASVEESLYRARLDYYDLYLIHWPNPSRGYYVEAWRALIEAQRRGHIRSIGVCNFLPEHLQALIDATGVVPSINQIEVHPYFPQTKQRAWDHDHGIVTQSWSPLGRANQLLQDTAIGAVADRLGKTIPQVILRWHVQLGAIPLPKAASPSRQTENIAIFDFSLSNDDMAALSKLARADGRTFGQDPAVYEAM